MIAYQLPNGKSILLTVRQFLEMSDEDFKLANEMGIGRVINNPFQNVAEGDREEEDNLEEPLELLSEEDEPTTEIDLDSLFLDDDSLI